jgi:hypothetical protein
MQRTEVQRIRIKKHASIGAADAETDKKYLESCFIDNGDLASLLDLDSAKRLIVGRTGAGKSALIAEVAKQADNSISLDLSALSLSYISNSDIIQFFESIGVNLDVFYALLWRHVFTVELLKKKFHIKVESDHRLKDFLHGIFARDKGKERAVKYLEEWGSQFWKETEYRVKEFVNKLEGSLSASAHLSGMGSAIGTSSAAKVSEEVKSELIIRAQKVVNEVQIQDLGRVIDLLANDVFDDKQQPYYITIDKLDEQWASEKIRYKLIRALLETVRTFQKIPSVKIIVALRVDLLERVFSETRDSGFQEEKYESLYLPLRWTASQLRSLVDARLTQLFKEQYTSKGIGFTEIFPNRVNNSDAFDYLVERTFMRPRDLILFINGCLELVEGKTTVPASIIKEAEAEYSRKRLRSIADEWTADFPHFFNAVQFLKGRKEKLRVDEISESDVDSFITDICLNDTADSPLFKLAADVTSNKAVHTGLLVPLMEMFYRVGVIGLKPEAFNEVQWTFKEKSAVQLAHVDKSTSIFIHPMVWRALGIVPHTKHS